MKITAALTALIFALALLPHGADAQDAAPAAFAPVLKHPVAVVGISAGNPNSQLPPFLAKLDIGRDMKTDEGIVLTIEEWSTALDLTKSKIADSGVLRIMEMPSAWTKADNSGKIKPEISTPDYILLARFGVGRDGRRVFFRLIEPYTGSALVSSEEVGEKFDDAIVKALVKIENDVAARAWRCRVIETAGDKMIINRGQLDGIREGDAFQGYKLDAAYKQAEPVPDELLLMKYGAKAGKYKVTEAGNLFSKIESADNAPQLSPGDILEQPDIWLKDRKRESRNKRVWDKIYDKK